MAWANSSIFREWPKSVMGFGQATAILPATYAGLGADTVNVSLFNNNAATPDKDATLATTGYNSSTSQWLAANQSNDANWVLAGRPLASKTFTTPATGVFMFDAADLAGGGNITMSGVQGCLCYDDTITAGTGIADQGICFNYFGGAQSVTAGTFTILWNANGVFRLTMS